MEKRTGKKAMSGGQRSLLLVGLGTLLFLVGLHTGLILNPTVDARRQEAPESEAHSLPLAEAQRPSTRWLQESLAPVVRMVQNSVVNISTTENAVSGRLRTFFNNPLVREFMSDPVREFPRELRERSLGSGVIVEPEGYILTNYHVVNRSGSTIVTFADHRKQRARVIGTDPETDLAVIKVDRANVPVMRLGDSAHLRVGDFVLAVGNPFGLDHSITFGIISALGRRNLSIAEYEDFIQTDAAINPGNSGGALVNLRAELIGINTAIASRDHSGNQGVGFSIPVDMAGRVLQQILQHGRVIRGWLGVAIQPLHEAMAEELGLAEPTGALVAQVEANSPAARAQIRRGDVIIEFAGQRIRDASQLRNLLGRSSPDMRVEVKLVRDHHQQVVMAQLAEKERRSFGIARLGSAGNQGERSGSRFEDPLAGIEVRDVTAAFLIRFHLPGNAPGAGVVGIESNSPAESAGLRKGDLIQEMDHYPITDAADFQRLAAAHSRNRALLLINRGGRTFFVVLEARE